MKRASVIVATVVLGAACSQAPAPQFRTSPATPIAVRGAPASAFVPLVQASSLQPRCEDLRNPPPELGHRVLSFIFGNPPEQRITIVLDSRGKPTSYSDARGDLILSDDHVGEMTVISLNLVRGYAIAQNRAASGESQALRIPLEEALVSDVLGRPQATLERVLATCGGETTQHE